LLGEAQQLVDEYVPEPFAPLVDDAEAQVEDFVQDQMSDIQDQVDDTLGGIADDLGL